MLKAEPLKWQNIGIAHFMAQQVGFKHRSDLNPKQVFHLQWIYPQWKDQHTFL